MYQLVAAAAVSGDVITDSYHQTLSFINQSTVWYNIVAVYFFKIETRFVI